MAKAFNTLPAALLAQDPRRERGNRVIFLPGNDEGAMAEVTLVRQLGSAPVPLGTLETGGMLMQLGGALMVRDLIHYGRNSRPGHDSRDRAADGRSSDEPGGECFREAGACGALGGWTHRLGDVTGVAPGRPGGRPGSRRAGVRVQLPWEVKSNAPMTPASGVRPEAEGEAVGPATYWSSPPAYRFCTAK